MNPFVGARYLGPTGTR
jgi:hypothetical protein